MKIAHFGTGVLLEGYFQKKGEVKAWGSPGTTASGLTRRSAT
jgi:hypothetical protein